MCLAWQYMHLERKLRHMAQKGKGKHPLVQRAGKNFLRHWVGGEVHSHYLQFVDTICDK